MVISREGDLQISILNLNFLHFVCNVLQVVTVVEHKALVVELVRVQQLPDAVNKLYHKIFQPHSFAPKRLFTLLSDGPSNLCKLVE